MYRTALLSLGATLLVACSDATAPKAPPAPVSVTPPATAVRLDTLQGTLLLAAGFGDDYYVIKLADESTVRLSGLVMDDLLLSMAGEEIWVVGVRSDEGNVFTVEAYGRQGAQIEMSIPWVDIARNRAPHPYR
jgi:hypothetical protein